MIDVTAKVDELQAKLNERAGIEIAIIAIAMGGGERRDRSSLRRQLETVNKEIDGRWARLHSLVHKNEVTNV